SRRKPHFHAAVDALLEGLSHYPKEIEVHVVSCNRRSEECPEKLADNVFFHQPVIPALGWGKSAFIGCAWKVRGLLKEIQPDLVHAQGTERDCAVSAVGSGYPNVVTIHGNMQQIFRLRLLGATSYYRMASFLETQALKRTQGVLCNSNHTRSLVEGRTGRTWLVPNPVRPAFLMPADEPRIRNRIPVLLVVGVVTRLKRSLEILETMRALYRAGRRFKLTFIGGHSANHEYGARFQEALNLGESEGWVEYAGVLNEAELIHAMDRADALVHFPHEEAFGLVVAEALARNLRVFVSNVGGIPDVVMQMKGAAQFDSLLDLRKGVDTWLSAGAPESSGDVLRVRDRYAPDVIAKAHLRIYREVLESEC
ncbi:MAG: glycosyltransferase family 4 protein, partial [Verrucomicrobiales bacterium]